MPGERKKQISFSMVVWKYRTRARVLTPIAWRMGTSRIELDKETDKEM